jgi:hypothetical protein
VRSALDKWCDGDLHPTAAAPKDALPVTSSGAITRGRHLVRRRAPMPLAKRQQQHAYGQHMLLPLVAPSACTK